MSSPALAFSGGGGGGGGGVPHGGTPGGDSLGSGGFGTDARPARSPSQTSLSALAASGGPAGAGQAAVKRLSAGSLAATAPQLPHAPAPALFQDLALLVAGSGRSTHGAAAGECHCCAGRGCWRGVMSCVQLVYGDDAFQRTPCWPARLRHSPPPRSTSSLASNHFHPNQPQPHKPLHSAASQATSISCEPRARTPC